MNPKELLQRYIPPKEQLHQSKYLSFLGERLHEPSLWHLNRRSAAGAVANGVFVAFLPLPGHMIIAAIVALFLRINLPVSVLSVWINNPITLAPICLLAYETGALLFHAPPIGEHFTFSLAWVTETLAKNWEPFLLGCILLGSISAILGYLGVRALWRWHAIKKWQARKATRLERAI